MTENNKSGIFKNIFNMMLMVSKIFGLLELSTALAAEARLAGKSIVQVLILAVLLAMLIMAAWLSLLSLIALYLVYSAHFSWLLAAFIVCILNLLLIIAVLIFMNRTTRNFSFWETRQCCKRICRD